MSPIKIITKTGDDGTTGLNCGARCCKIDPRIIAVGKIDTLHAQMGIAITFIGHQTYHDIDLQKQLSTLHSIFYNMMGEIACHDSSLYRSKFSHITQSDADMIDGYCQHIGKALDDVGYQLTGWINYGSDGKLPTAQLDLCSKVCREAEIAVLSIDSRPRPVITKLLNRLGDYFYLAARLSSC